MCSLLSKLLKRHMSPTEIANAMYVRDKSIAPRRARISAETVEHIFEIAKSPSGPEIYPTACRYKKWEAVRDRLAARNGVIDGNDEEMGDASLIFKGTLAALKMIESLGIGAAVRFLERSIGVVPARG